VSLVSEHDVPGAELVSIYKTRLLLAIETNLPDACLIQWLVSDQGSYVLLPHLAGVYFGGKGQYHLDAIFIILIDKLD
jgi:hypothetical protein